MSRRPALLRQAALGGLLCAGLLLADTGPASAHAQLESTAPFDGEELARAPSEVRLEFNEAVTAPAGGVRVFNSAAQRVDAGDAAAGPSPEIVSAPLPDQLRDGTYVVTWRVTSADGHPVAGAFVFAVGEPLGASDSLVEQLFASGADRAYAIAAGVVRWLGYAGALLAAGGVAFLIAARRQIGDERARLARVVGGGAVLAAAAAVAEPFLQAALVTGLGAAALVSPAALGAALGGPVGISSGVRLLGLGAIAVALRRPDSARFAAAGLGGAGVAAGSLLLAGHTLTTGPRWLVVAADAAHVGAAAVWFSGLVLLATALRTRRRADDPAGAGRLVARFSQLASVAVVTVIAAGLALGWAEVRALRALVTTPYGWTLLVKSALLAPVLGAAVYNNRRLVPALTAPRPVAAITGGSGPLPETEAIEATERPAGGARAWRLLQRAVAIEIAGLAAVLGATAMLVNLQPAAEAAGITGAYSTYVPLGDEHQVNVTVDPNRVGINEIHLYVLSGSGRQVDVGEDVEFALSLPAHDVGPIARTPQRAGPGHFLLTGPELSLPGTWVIEITVEVSRFEELRATVPVTVNR